MYLYCRNTIRMLHVNVSSCSNGLKVSTLPLTELVGMSQLATIDLRCMIFKRYIQLSFVCVQYSIKNFLLFDRQ